MNEQDNKKAFKNYYKRQQLDEIRRSLPMSVALFKQLFDFLEENLSEEKTDFNLTQQFCAESGIDFDPLRNWLIENGAGDDFEIVWNVQEQFEKS